MWILWKMRDWKCEFCEKMRLWNCEFCEKWDVENVNFVKNEIFKLWILSKMKLFHWGKCHSIEKRSAHLMLMWPKNKCGECEFCQKWSFSIVGNVISIEKKSAHLMLMWISVENVNSDKNEAFQLGKMWFLWEKRSGAWTKRGSLSKASRWPEMHCCIYRRCNTSLLL